MNTNSDRRDPLTEQAAEWLIRLHAAPGRADLRAARDAWLARGEDQVRAYRRVESAWRLAGLLPAPSAHCRRRHILLAPVALAAALTALLLPGLATRWEADLRTGTAETRRVVLADGSRVELDAESALDITLAPERRGVTLRAGRAFFQVAPDHARPFTVTAGELTVTVTGTAFDVALTDREASVEVESGRVTVNGGASLSAGGRARLSRADGRLAVGAVPPGQIGLWRQGRLVVEGASVAEVVAELRRHYHGLILLPDQTLAARRVTGVFNLSDPAAALDAVLLPHGGMARRLAPGLLLVSAR